MSNMASSQSRDLLRNLEDLVDRTKELRIDCDNKKMGWNRMRNEIDSNTSKCFRVFKNDQDNLYNIEECADLSVETYCLIPNLSQEQENFVDELIDNYIDSDEAIIAKYYPDKSSCCIEYRDIRTLDETRWLNDSIINSYMALLANQCRKINILSLNSFFYIKLKNNGPDESFEMISDVKLFDYDLILIPIHLTNHWCLAAIDFIKHKLLYFDSLGRKNDTCLTLLHNFLAYYAEKKKIHKFDQNLWRKKFKSNVPQQNNGYDCGVFACLYARCMAFRDKNFNFNQCEIKSFRLVMRFELTNGKIIK